MAFKRNDINKMTEYFSKKNNHKEIIMLQEEFREECIRLSGVAKKYKSIINTKYNNLASNVAKREYSTGGELITRGYYCPSPIYDIVTSNCNRGKLLRKVTSKSKSSYEYCFDKDNKLIIINSIYSNTVEVLDYISNDLVFGVSFSPNNDFEILSVVECRFQSDGRISSFIEATSCSNDCDMDELEKEIYTYNDQGLFKAEIFHYLHQNPLGVVNYESYLFEHDEDGFLKEYKVENSVFEDDVYKVFIKRKV